MASTQDIREEQIRMIRLRVLVDLTAYRLQHATLSCAEARVLIEGARDLVLELFPDKGDVFDLVVRPRFNRIVNERALVEWGVTDTLN